MSQIKGDGSGTQSNISVYKPTGNGNGKYLRINMPVTRWVVTIIVALLGLGASLVAASKTIIRPDVQMWVQDGMDRHNDVHARERQEINSTLSEIKNQVNVNGDRLWELQKSIKE